MVGFGAFVRAVRNRKNLEREEFAKRIGVHPVTIAKWETNAAVPKPKHFEKMIRLVDVKWEDCLQLPNPSARKEELRELVREILYEEKSNSPPGKASK